MNKLFKRLLSAIFLITPSLSMASDYIDSFARYTSINSFSQYIFTNTTPTLAYFHILLNRDILNGIVFFAIFASIIFGVYSKLSKGKEPEIKFFSMFSLCIAAGYLRHLLYDSFFDQLFLYKFSRTAIIILPHLVLLFITSFYRYSKIPPKLFMALLIITRVPTLTLLWLENDVEGVASLFALSVASFGVFELILATLILAKNLREVKQKDEFLIFSGTLIFTAALLVDALIVVANHTPFFWNIPFGYMVMGITLTTSVLIKNNRHHRQITAFNEKISEANERIKREEELRENYLKIIAHEIRTPLNGINGTIEDLENSHNPENFEIHKNAVRRLSSTLNNIFTFVALSEDKLPHETTPFLAEKEMQMIRHHYRAECARRGISFIYDLYPIPPLAIDGHLILQIIENLLQNSLNYTYSGFISLSTRYEMNNLIIDVLDSGSPLQQNANGEILDRYSAISSYSRKDNDGGISFALTTAVTQKLGGKIDIETEKCGSNKIVVTIPSSEVDLPLEEALLPRAKNILVVEDNQTNQIVIEKMLLKLSCQVTLCDNGLEALELLEEREFDLIFMDIQMPLLNGIETTKLIRERGCNTPIIAITANALQEECFEAGMNHYLQKPFLFSDIEKSILYEKNWITSKA